MEKTTEKQSKAILSCFQLKWTQQKDAKHKWSHRRNIAIPKQPKRERTSLCICDRLWTTRRVNAQAGSRADHSRQSCGILQSVNSTKVLFRYVFSRFVVFFLFFHFLWTCVGTNIVCIPECMLWLIFYVVVFYTFVGWIHLFFDPPKSDGCCWCSCCLRFQMNIEYLKLFLIVLRFFLPDVKSFFLCAIEIDNNLKYEEI